MLQKIDHLQQTGLICYYPGSTYSFPVQACRWMIDELASKPQLKGYIGSILTILRLGSIILQSEFEEMMSLTK